MPSREAEKVAIVGRSTLLDFWHLAVSYSRECIIIVYSSAMICIQTSPFTYYQCVIILWICIALNVWSFLEPNDKLDSFTSTAKSLRIMRIFSVYCYTQYYRRKCCFEFKLKLQLVEPIYETILKSFHEYLILLILHGNTNIVKYNSDRALIVNLTDLREQKHPAMYNSPV